MKLSLKSAVTGVAVLLLGVAVLLAGLAWRTLNHSQATLHTLLVDRVEPLEDLSAIRALLQINASEFLDAVLDVAGDVPHGHAMMPDALAQQFAHNRAQIDRHWARYAQTYLTPEEAILFRQFEDQRARWLAAANVVLQQAQADGRLELRHALAFSAARDHYGSAVLATLDSLVALQVRVAREEGLKAEAEHAALRQQSLWLLLGALLAGGLALARLGRAINRPLAAMRAMLGDFASGNMRARIHNPKDALTEFAALQRDINAMAEQVEDGQSLMDATLTAMSAGVLLIDRRGRIRQANDALVRMTGSVEADLIGRPLASLFTHFVAEEEEEEEVFARLIAGMGSRLDRLALAHPEDYYSLLNDAPLACLQVGQDGSIRYANAQAHQLTGFAPGTLQGQALAVLIPQAVRGGHGAQMAQFQKSSGARRMGVGRSLKMVTGNGEEIAVEVGLVNHDMAGERVTLAFVRGTTDLPWSVITSTSFGHLFVEEEEERMVLWLRGAQGHSTPVQVTVSVVRDGRHAGQLAAASITDVSLMLRSKQEAERKGDLLARVQHAMHDGLLLIDRGGQITEINPRGLELLGCSQAEALSRSIGQFFEEEEEEEEEEVMMRWMPALHGTGLQRLYAADPQRFWIRLWEMVHPLLVFGEGGRVAFANPSAERMLGAARGELIGRSCQDLIDEGSQSVMRDLLDAKLHHDAGSDTDVPGVVWKAGDACLVPQLTLCPVQSLEAPLVVCCLDGSGYAVEETELLAEVDQERWIKRPDGSRVLVVLSGAPLRDAQGHVTGAVISIKDISELSVMKERDKMLVQTTHQAKLATLGEMATGVMHEVNQPLTYISSVMQTLKRARKKALPLSDDKIAEMLDEGLRQVDRISKIMNHLRTFGRADATEGASAVHWPEVLDNALILLGKKLAHANVALIPEIADAVPAVLGNPNAFEQILINFFQNAVHALEGRKDGEVRLGMHVLQNNDKQWVELTFADNGSGMPPEVRDKCFEPFFTTKAVGVGTGIGLSLVHGIVTQYGGMIRVDSEPGQGTSFTLQFPVLG